MATAKYLMNRNGVYYARISVPLAMRDEIGKKEIWKSLGLRSYREASEAIKQGIWADILTQGLNNQQAEQLSKTLIDVGFLKFYERVKKDPRADNKLFPYCTRGAVKPAAPFSQWFSRQLISLGIKTEKTSFHSLRHNFRDYIREARLSSHDNQVALSLSGWAQSGVNENYGLGFSIITIKEVMDKIPLKGLELKALLDV